MKRLMFLLIIILNFSCFSEIKEFNGDLGGILTDGEKIFSLVYYEKYHASCCPLLPRKTENAGQ